MQVRPSWPASCCRTWSSGAPACPHPSASPPAATLSQSRPDRQRLHGADQRGSCIPWALLQRNPLSSQPPPDPAAAGSSRRHSGRDDVAAEETPSGLNDALSVRT